MKGFLKDKFDRVAHLKTRMRENFRDYAALLEMPREERIKLPDGEIAPLTEGEVSFARGIFGEEINTDIVRKIFLLMKSPRKSSAAVLGTRAIIFYEMENYSFDFSGEKNAWKLGMFAHELTHIWQKQVQFRNTKDLTMSYEYTLNGQNKFEDYSIEQQASIIGEYSSNYLMLDAQGKYAPERIHIVHTCMIDEWLQRIVEDQFPQARITRLAVEAKRAALMAQNAAMAGPAP